MSLWELEVEPALGERFRREIGTGTLTVGRGADCDVQIPDTRVSRLHCRLYASDDGLEIEDLGSRRGTRVNGAPLEGRRRLGDGDLVELSDHSRFVAHSRAATREIETGTSSGLETLFRDATSLVSQSGLSSAAPSQTELARLAERLRMLSEVHQALGSSLSRDALLEMILDRVFRHLRPEQAAVLLLDEKGDLVRSVTRPAGLAVGELFFSRSLVREVVGKRLAALVVDARTDARFAQAASILSAGVRSVLAAPLPTPDRVLGLIVLSSRFQVRPFDESDLELLASLASVAALYLRNLALAEEAAERLRLEQELALARRIQVALLPSELPEIEGYEMLAGNIPSRGVSGDLYTVAVHPDTGAVTCFVADVSGKGMAASLLGASLEALAAGPIEVGHPPDEICLRVSRRLYPRTPPEKYATAFVVKLDPATHWLEWANAGHNPALFVRESGIVERLTATGPPIGLLPTASYRAQGFTLAPGDLLVVYTDGITEASNPADEEFGLERLVEVCRESAKLPLVEVRDAIELALANFVRGVPFADDRTLVLLRRASGPLA